PGPASALAPRRAAALGLALLAGCAVIFTAVGFIGGSPAGAPGYEWFSFDLLSPLDGGGMSRLLPDLHRGEGHYEGFCYLGLGGALASAAGIAAFSRRRDRARLLRRLTPLIVPALLLALFALSSRWTFAGRTALTARALYGPIRPLARAFRASGRFAWPAF